MPDLHSLAAQYLYILTSEHPAAMAGWKLFCVLLIQVSLYPVESLSAGHLLPPIGRQRLSDPKRQTRISPDWILEGVNGILLPVFKNSSLPAPNGLVVFSRGKPDLSPFEITSWRKWRSVSRAERSADLVDYNIRPACDSVSRWGRLSEAVSYYDTRVTVADRISSSGHRLFQFFYQTSCRREGSPCLGVDNRTYASRCVTRSTYTYGCILDERGREVWIVIKVNGSCNCAVRHRSFDAVRSVLGVE